MVNRRLLQLSSCRFHGLAALSSVTRGKTWLFLVPSSAPSEVNLVALLSELGASREVAKLELFNKTPEHLQSKLRQLT